MTDNLIPFPFPKEEPAMLDEHSPCNQWCGDDCDPDEGLHSSSAIIAARGGPMGEEDTDRTVDIAPSVGVSQYDSCMAEVTIQANTWLRNVSGWGIPGELLHLLPGLKLTATRARVLAAILMDAADQVDEINDRTPAREES